MALRPIHSDPHLVPREGPLQDKAGPDPPSEQEDHPGDARKDRPRQRNTLDLEFQEVIKSLQDSINLPEKGQLL